MPDRWTVAMWALAIISLVVAMLSFLGVNNLIQETWVWVTSSYAWLPLVGLSTFVMLQRGVPEHQTAVLQGRNDWYKPSLALRACLSLAILIGLASYFWQAG